MPAFFHSGHQKPNTFMLWPPSPITVTLPLNFGTFFGTGTDLRAAIISLRDMSPKPGAPATADRGAWAPRATDPPKAAAASTARAARAVAASETGRAAARLFPLVRRGT